MTEEVTTVEEPTTNATALSTDVAIVENNIYYLVSGEVLAHHKNDINKVYSSKHNTIIFSKREQITPKELATAQWSLEDNFLNSIPKEDEGMVQVDRVVLFSFVPLGYFSKEEWEEFYS